MNHFSKRIVALIVVLNCLFACSVFAEMVLIQKGIIQQQAELILMLKVLVVLLVDWFLMHKEFL